MKILEEFYERYQKEYDYYSSLAKIVSEKCEQELSKRSIKSIVSYRAKKIDSLKIKIQKRNKNYESVQEVYDDISDLSGVRIALYFPNDKIEVKKMIHEIFDLSKEITFPDLSKIPNRKKVFSGYSAEHYRVKLKKDNIDSVFYRYTNTITEIQVASLLMHSWAEVEHDLAYKPPSGDLSEEEYAILDELNGLVLTGEIALERLQKAILKRISSKQNNFNDNFELKYFIQNKINLKNDQINNLGYFDLLSEFLSQNNLNNSDKINKFLNNLDINSEIPISDQILESILLENKYNNKFYKFINDYVNSNKILPDKGFEVYIKSWIIFEKTLRQYYEINNIERTNMSILSREVFIKNRIFDKNEIQLIDNLRKIRNNVIHGIENLDSNILMIYSKELNLIIKKLLNKITGDSIKEKLESELNKLFESY